MIVRDRAPIVVLAYNRPRHLQATLTSLMRCEGFAGSPLLIFADGPRGAGDSEAVHSTRKVAQDLLGDAAEYHFAESNKGLANSVIDAVSSTVDRYGRVIVVEDDLELHPGFLAFLNQALDRYENEAQVFQVSGYMFDLPVMENFPSAFFLPFTVSWGWATWQRAWQEFDPQAEGWQALKSDHSLRGRFNLNGAYDYATMLERQMQGLRDSWAIRWYWSVFKARGLVLFPPVSYVRNRGFDGSGTHGSGRLRRFGQSGRLPVSSGIECPAKVNLDEQLFARVCHGMRRQHGGRFASTIDWLRRVIKR